jgi:hypothetical protein
VQLPVIRGIIARRILLNFREEPGILEALLPKPFRPWLVDGYGMAGICLIRLNDVRPRGFPRAFGFGSENAAHRIAVEWEHQGTRREGVLMPRRDTSSRLNSIFGGRLFPGVHHFARFQVQERNDTYRVELDSEDDATHLAISAQATDAWPEHSVFGSLAAASEFFQRGSLGYSTTRRPGTFDGLELQTRNWSVSPLAIEHLHSSYFEDRSRFPAGSITFGCALIMHNIEHEWHSREPICCG